MKDRDDNPITADDIKPGATGQRQGRLLELPTPRGTQQDTVTVLTCYEQDSDDFQNVRYRRS